jgi:D-3-phosphoglycerate dehydrogenase / 2-oxoglutarate reductase
VSDGDSLGRANGQEGAALSDGVVDSLVLDLLEWMGPDARPYGEVLEAWRTSCPRLPVWEEANDRGFVVRLFQPGRGQLVSVSDAGRKHLRENRPTRPTTVT